MIDESGAIDFICFIVLLIIILTAGCIILWLDNRKIERESKEWKKLNDRMKDKYNQWNP